MDKNVDHHLKDAARKHCLALVFKVSAVSPYNNSLNLANKKKVTLAFYSNFEGFYIIDKTSVLSYWHEARKRTT